LVALLVECDALVGVLGQFREGVPLALEKLGHVPAFTRSDEIRDKTGNMKEEKGHRDRKEKGRMNGGGMDVASERDLSGGGPTGSNANGTAKLSRQW
jgi:hypothetical protein